jgi:hypothetical protein
MLNLGIVNSLNPLFSTTIFIHDARPHHHCPQYLPTSPHQHQQHGKAPCHQPQTLNEQTHTISDMAQKRLRNTRDNNGARRRIVMVVIKVSPSIPSHPSLPTQLTQPHQTDDGGPDHERHPQTTMTQKHAHGQRAPTTTICTPLMTTPTTWTMTPTHERAAPTDDNAPPQMACAQPTNPAMQGHDQASDMTTMRTNEDNTMTMTQHERTATMCANDERQQGPSTTPSVLKSSPVRFFALKRGNWKPQPVYTETDIKGP